MKVTSTFSIRNRKFSCWLPVAQSVQAADSCCTVSINTGDKGLLQEPSCSPPSVLTPKTQTVPVEGQWKLKSELHSQEGYPGPLAHPCRPTQIRSWRRSAQLIWTTLRAKHICFSWKQTGNQLKQLHSQVPENKNLLVMPQQNWICPTNVRQNR